MGHPMQAVIMADYGIVRFAANELVVWLLENGGISMNDIACQDFSDNDRRQFAQLIGYSVSGYGGLSYA